MAVAAQPTRLSQRYTSYKAKVGAALSRRMPAGLDLLLATLSTDVSKRAPQQPREAWEPHRH